MKSVLLTLDQGITQVPDKAVIQANFATCLDNVNVRSGFIRPFKAPKLIKELDSTPINSLSCPGSDAVSIFWSRGLMILAAAERQYTSEYVGDSERIYYTEYGGSPQKIVDGVTVPLGLKRPLTHPSISTIKNLGIHNFTVTEETGGNFTKDQIRSYRIALKTDEGVLPPTNKIVVKSSDANKGFRLQWDQTATTGIKVIEILIFAGDSDKERRIASVPSGQTYYFDDGSVNGTAGEMASSYDIDYEFTYLYTFVRNVRGMEDESGPSPQSPYVRSTSARNVGLPVESDGFFDSPNLITNDYGTINIKKLENEAAYLTFAVTSIAQDVDTGYVRFNVSSGGKFWWKTGDKIRIYGIPALDGIAYEIVTDEDPETIADRMTQGQWANKDSFLVDLGSVPVFGPGITVAKVMSYTLSSGFIDSTTSTVAFDLSEEHTLHTGQIVTFPGSGYGPATQYTITVSPTNPKRFFIDSIPFNRLDPTGGYGASVKAHEVLVECGGYSPYTPYDGDATKLNLMAGGSGLSGIYKAKAGGQGSFTVDEYITASYTATSTTGMVTFIPHNDYIIARRVYRIGDTGDFLRVKDVEPHLSSFVDAKPTTQLYDVLPSSYEVGGATVTWDVPPQGMHHIISHYDMKFAIYGNSVRWTENGYPDAWPEEHVQEFKYQPQNIKSFDGAVVVFCEDAIYSLLGNTASTMSVTITEAVDGCIAPNSVQETNRGVFYLSRRGIMLYRGGQADCITDTRIHPEIMLGTSYFVDPSMISTKSDYFWLHSRHSALYRNMAATDQRVAIIPGDPVGLEGTMSIPGIINEIKSFYANGRYFMYWANIPSKNMVSSWMGFPNPIPNNYQCHTTICIDTYSDSFPITTLGFKPKDVFVTENEDVLFLGDGCGVSGGMPA